ncbi:hypothetical protein F3Y22_tig00110556pilonHSYRG00789 [Hibiscus syriacus]|uniref:BZIP domain-containing protein n=1 Tax=Hibiscus syriacus TaxID=106335 RepID=A0A6A3AD78_HIBSY|nr:hypothetical protein F3Y22_tig00110556pilonHSYRG00789 [Hibiscus syriacus]
MDGKNKNIAQEIPSATSTWPEYPIAATGVGANANPFTSMSPSNLPISPTSFNYVGQKPYFMNQAGAVAGPTVGASNSETMPSFFSGLDHFLMSDEMNKTDQNPFPLPAENLILGPYVKTVVGNGVQGSESCEKEQIMEQRRLNRVISNRLSAQRSRMRKLQHIYDMEKQVESLQTQVIVLSAQIQQQKEKQFLQINERQQLQNRISACANRRVMVDAEIEEKKAELNRLRELQLMQQGLPTKETPINPSLNVDNGKDYIDEEMNELNLQQEDPGHMTVAGWEASGGELTNVGLDQSGPEQLQIESSNSDFEELEEILKLNPGNDFHIN